MKVTNGPERVWLVALDRWVEPREEVEVPEDVGNSLVDQGWVSARSKAAKRAARKRVAKKAAPKKAAPKSEPEENPEPDTAAAEEED
jgi:hypothetical protein